MDTTDEILATVELTTSKLNVAFRLSILDQGEEVLSKTGMGQVIIPMFRFLASKGERAEGSMVVKEGNCYFCAVNNVLKEVVPTAKLKFAHSASLCVLSLHCQYFFITPAGWLNLTVLASSLKMFCPSGFVIDKHLASFRSS